MATVEEEKPPLLEALTCTVCCPVEMRVVEGCPGVETTKITIILRPRSHLQLEVTRKKGFHQTHDRAEFPIDL